MTTPNINSFSITTVKGQLTELGLGSNVVSCQVDSDASDNVAQGQAVKLVDNAGGVPKVEACDADDDTVFGFAVRNLKDQYYVPGQNLEVALINSVMVMEAGAAIARGAKLEIDASTQRVITNAGTNPVVGFAYDKATNAGDLIRVYILTQSYQSAQVIADIAGLQDALDDLDDASVKTAIVTASLAELNAGKTLVAGVTGKKVTVLNYTARVAGNFAAATGIYIRSTNASPVVVSAIAVAGLTDGAILMPSSGNTTLGAGFAAELGVDDGVRAIKNGIDLTTGTSITFTITYKQA